MIYLAVYLLNKRKSQRENLLILIYVLSTSGFCLLYPLIMKRLNSDWFYLTITINLVLYYIFLLQQYTKIDSLTKLLNRQTYYADLVNYGGSITAVITMDMNGLKTINDSEGHIAGYHALKALADCFLEASLGKQRVYRIGGDEYVVLCLNSGEKEVLGLIERIRKEVANTRYTCCIGYAMKTEGFTVEQAYKQADQMLYEEKSQYYMYSGKDRRKR